MIRGVNAKKDKLGKSTKNKVFKNRLDECIHNKFKVHSFKPNWSLHNKRNS